MVLIILASVSLNMVLGDSGIITEAKRAANKTVEMELNTQVSMNELQKEIEKQLKQPLPDGMDETDAFLDAMGDKEITQDDIDDFNKTLEDSKKIIGIRTIEDLKKIGVDENYPLNGLYVVLNDISLQGENWNPISTENSPFTGIFNGANKTLDNLTITQAEMNAGLFGFNKGKIKNIQLTNVSISSEHTMVGGITGQNSGIIRNCIIENGSISGTGNDTVKDINGEEADNGGSRVGGICGYSVGGDIDNCENTGNIKGTVQIGGIAGDSEGLSSENISYLKNSKNYGNITQTVGTERPTDADVGGIVGTNFKYSVVEDCYNQGSISAEANNEGGIIGFNFYLVQNCENAGELTNTKHYIGGIVGGNIGPIIACKNTGNIMASATTSSFVGGVAGIHRISSLGNSLLEPIAEKCSNSGKVQGNNYVGGVVGRLGEEVALVSCYNVGSVLGDQRVGGIVGDTVKTSLKMENVYNKGNITANTNYVGGIVGVLHSPVENAYNVGNITLSSTNTNVGGIIGNIVTNEVGIEEVKNCYYLDSSCQNAIGNLSEQLENVKSKTISEMKTLADLLGSEFKNSTDGDGYPKLIWE